MWLPPMDVLCTLHYGYMEGAIKCLLTPKALGHMSRPEQELIQGEKEGFS